MNWLNLNTQTLDSENFVGSNPVERGTWLCLLRYCIGQENGGVISGCADWPDRKWQQLVRVTKKEVGCDCALWSVSDAGLVVWGYPVDKESEVRERRVVAKTNGSLGGRPKKTNEGTKQKPTSVNSGKAEGEGEGEGEVPPNPQGGMGADELKLDPEPPKPKNILPTGWEKMNGTAKKQARVNMNSSTMNRIGKMLGRRDGTLWTVAEALALKTVNPQADEITLMEGYYLAEIDKDDDFRRHDLLTLLNNWNGELDRARIYQSNQ